MRRNWGWVFLMVICFLFPLFGGEYYINLASQIFIFAVFAASINLLLGYGGLPTLGHAAYLGVAAYLSALCALKLGWGHLAAAPAALLGTTLMAAAFGLIALRATGLGFLMLTLALSQVLWGTALRWVSMTDGDNGLRGLARPAPFGINLDGSVAFYYFTLVVTVVALWFMARFVLSPFGAALKGTRDQARRMSALGHDVWMVRWLTFIYAGFWGAVSGLLFVYYHKYIHPVSLSLANSAEGLLAVIAGGAGTLAGPLVGATIVMLVKNYLSAPIERWNMLLGFIFVFIVVLMPDGVGPGIRRYWRERARYRIGIAFAVVPMIAAGLLVLLAVVLSGLSSRIDFVLVRIAVVTYGVAVFIALPAYGALRRWLPMSWIVCVVAGGLCGALVPGLLRMGEWVASGRFVEPGSPWVLVSVGMVSGLLFWALQQLLAAGRAPAVAASRQTA